MTVEVRPAFSAGDKKEIQYVQHRPWKDRFDIHKLIEQGARIYVCGDGKRMAPAIRETFGRIYQHGYHCSNDQAQDWMNHLEQNLRYSQDVFV